MSNGFVKSIGRGVRRAASRAFSAGLPTQAEIERFGADGEEAICRLLCAKFDCVIRNAVVPHQKKYLEKDFLVIKNGAPFVIEVKNWKGVIRREGDSFCQDKPNGEHKTVKTPVGTTAQFISCMKRYYSIERPIYGIVVFAEPDCTLDLPDTIDGIALLKADKLVSYINTCIKNESGELAPITEERILRCTRFYSATEEFCKGIMADDYLELCDENGKEILLDTTKLRYITVETQALHLRDKLYVTYTNGASGVFYNRDTAVAVACLDGSYRKIAINRVRYIVF